MNKKLQRLLKPNRSVYFSMMALDKGSARFELPFTRQEMADFLCVERSAMSAEIGKLKKEGWIDTKGSWFLVRKHPDK